MSYSTVKEDNEKRFDARMKRHAQKLFGRNNIMFDCVVSVNDGFFHNSYVYTLTCKLCGHETFRGQRNKMLYVCGGCYREWLVMEEVEL